MGIEYAREVEVEGPALLAIEGGLYRKPGGEGICVVWQIPEKPSPTMMLMLWVTLLEENISQTPVEAPIRPFLLETLQRWQAMMKDGQAMMKEGG